MEEQKEMSVQTEEIQETVLEEESVSAVFEEETEEETEEMGEALPAGRRKEEPEEQDDSDLISVVGVRFRTAGKAYYFAIGDFPVKRGTHVIVETARGLEYGTSVCDPMKIHQKQFKAPLKKIIRVATAADDSRVKENREKEREAYRVCFEKIRRHNLDMKLIDAEYTFDNNKILFYFTSDGRVDFRDLVKDLAGVFRTRIELRQIGVRDETKILGGYGICGRPLCCHTYLADFIPVSIKMAKEQNLSLNPTKISGACGRLMCCLKNEEETYEELNRNLPKLGDEVQTADGLTGEVAGTNILKQTVRILVEVDDEKELHECRADEITILRRRKRGQAKPKINRNELKNPSGPSRQRKDAKPAGKTEETPGGAALQEGTAEKRKSRDARPAQERKSDDGEMRGAGTRERRGRRGPGAGRERRDTEHGPNERRDRGIQNRSEARPQDPVPGGAAPEDNPGTPQNPGAGRRRHRNRRRNGGNDRRREEKPSETE